MTHHPTRRPDRRRVLAAGLALPASLLAGLATGLPATSARATPGVDEPPLPQPPRPLQLPALHQHTLPNGLTVVVAPRPGLPLVSLTLALRAGPEADPAGRPPRVAPLGHRDAGITPRTPRTRSTAPRLRVPYRLRMRPSG